MQRPLSLFLRAQGGGAFLPDRRDAVVAVGPLALRARRSPRRPARRRGRGFQLRRCSRARAVSPAGGVPAVEPAVPRDSRCPAVARAGQRQGPGRVPPLAELARRHPSRQCRTRAADTHRRARLHGGARALSERRRRRLAGAGAGRVGARAVRDDSPLPRRQRAGGKVAHHVPALSRRRAAGAAPVLEPVPEAEPRRLLRAP